MAYVSRVDACMLYAGFVSHVGWVSSLPHYCQIIRNANKEKRYLWCHQQTVNNEDFKDVIWSDECTVMIERKRKSYRRLGHSRKLKPKPKHPLRMHVWGGGISMKGATPLIMFKENLTAVRYAKILETGLIPFVRSKFTDKHKFQQDNDPKHRSHYIKQFLENQKIEWWKTPAESPDLNPIEVWGSMKNYLRDVHFRNPENRNLNGLKAGIKAFWKTLTPKVCSKYINHIKKVIPIIIQREGDASGQ